MIMARAVAALAACAAAFERVCPGDQPTNVSDTIFKERVVVFDEAMGARVVVAGDINKDGRNDLVVASSTDNAIRWFENLGDQGWSRPQKITYDAKGARVVALADIDGDGYLDVVYASYYDNTVGWFKNSRRTYIANNWIEGRALLLPAVVLDEGVPGAARPAEFARVAG